MNNIFIRMTVMSILFAVSSSVFADDKKGKQLVLNLVGTGNMYEGTVPDIDGDFIDDPAICFDVDLVDLKKQKVVGTATDCLSNITPMGTGLALVGTTYFNIKGETLVTRGNTTVQPVLHPTTIPDGQVITHTTGAAVTGNSIVAGTGRFANRTGTARLSGMVDMTNFTGMVGDPIYFNCLFIVDLDPSS